MRSYVVAMAAALFLPAADAGVISTFTSGTDIALGGYSYGRAVTTPAGGPWNGVVFAFLGPSVDLGGGVYFQPVVAPVGTLYLLSQEFGGLPTELSPSTPGFLGSSSSLTGDGWVFEESLTILPSTTYYFYNDSIMRGPGIDLFGAQGGYWTAFGGQTCDDTLDCVFAPTFASNFRLSAAIPEPWTASLMLPGMAILGVLGRRSRRLVAKRR